MKRLSSCFILFFIITMLNGCIISVSPSSTTVVLLPNQQQTFSVYGVPLEDVSYVWALDGKTVATTGNSYQYTWTGGLHTLIVTGTSTLGTASQSWTIIDAVAKKEIGRTGGIIQVTDPASPANGVKAVIPTGALSSPTTLAIAIVSAPSGLAEKQAGPCLLFWPNDIQFSKPVDLYLPYADKDNNGKVDGTCVPENLIKAWILNQKTGDLDMASIVDLDSIKNIIHIQANNLSRYVTSVHSIQWNKVYKNPQSVLNVVFNTVMMTNDGGYAILGEATRVADGHHDLLLIKADANGNLIWNKTLSGDENYYAYAAQQTSDGGYILAGYSTGSSSMALLIKTDEVGETLWVKTFGIGSIRSVQQTTDGGYIMVGSMNGVESLTKTDSNGNISWTVNKNGSSVQQTTDGGYILACISGSPRSQKLNLIKTNWVGTQTWETAFDTIFSSDPSVMQTSDGGYIIHVKCIAREHRFIKTDENGSFLWEKGIGQWQMACDMTSDGGYILAGVLLPSDSPNNSDIINTSMIRYDANGKILWNKAFGDGQSNHFSSVRQLSDGGFIMLGTTESYNNSGISEAWVVKTDQEGNAPEIATELQ